MQLEYDLVISQEFIDYRNDHEKNKFRKDRRTKKERLIAADCLLLEWHLMQTGLAEKPKDDTFTYDAEVPGYNRVEIKSISEGGYVTIKEWTRRQDFDNYFFFRFMIPQTRIRPFNVGDEVTIHITEIASKESVEARCVYSNYQNDRKNPKYFVRADKNKIAKPNFSMYSSREPVYSNPLFT